MDIAPPIEESDTKIPPPTPADSAEVKINGTAHTPSPDDDGVKAPTPDTDTEQQQSPDDEAAPDKPKSLNIAKKTPRFNIEKVQSPTPTAANNHSEFTHQNSVIQDTETIGYATHEAVPLTMFYRNQNTTAGTAKSRPTLAELHKGFDELDEMQDSEAPLIKDSKKEPDVEANIVVPSQQKFGWVKGVLVPCLLNIWGVILYLRLPWLTGQAGVLVITAIIILSAVVTTITTMSMSAICTNGEVKGGGAYYLISRSLGPEFGGSIGIIFSLANAIGVALYVVGFSETVQQMMERNNYVMVDKLNDIRIIGVIVVCILLGITLIGLSWVIRTQIILLGILILSMVDFGLGTFTSSVLRERSVAELQGFTSYSSKTFMENLLPEFRGETFFTTFSIFFPAATGILAGVNISGDLKDPQKAIPKGTFAAILLTTIVYIILAWMIGASSAKDAMGVVASAVAAANGSAVINATIPVVNATTTTTTAVPVTTSPDGRPSCIPNCKYGLLNDYQLMERFAILGPIVLAGIFAATLSSALASLVGSPKTFQAVCRDKIFKGLEFFGKGSGPNEEPRRAYVLTFFISTAFILIGQLDLIAPVISNFFLMSYALINYSVFAASLGKSPGWRPSFKYFNMWLSLLGTFLCVGIMFLVNWWAALVTIVIVMSLYKYVGYQKPKINWGSSGQAHTYIKALKLAHQLNRTDQHVKNFRPQCLVLTGHPSQRPNLAHFVSNLTRQVGLMICGQVVITKSDVLSDRDKSLQNQESWLQENKIKSFAAVTTAQTLRQGAQALIECSGLGKLRPNIVCLGFKHDWITDELQKVEEYVNIIHDAFEAMLSVIILRTPKGAVIDEYEDCDDEYKEELNLEELAGAFRIENGQNEEDVSASMNPLTPAPANNLAPAAPPQQAVTPRTSIRKKAGDSKGKAVEHNGDIDVWWLYDDGGLTILLPYLLSQNKQWKGCSLRILTPASDKKKNLKSNQVRMATLLKKFRITFSGIVEVEGMNAKPNQQSIDSFMNSRMKDEFKEEPLDKKTLRQIRFGELLKEHSSKAKLVVLTMPIGRKTVVSNLLYMGWLDVISNDLDTPILLVRGNQTNVLTFYS